MNLLDFTYKVAQENEFKIVKSIHEGIYYSADNIRDVVVVGAFQDKPAVLKAYNDPRIRDDGPRG